MANLETAPLAALPSDDGALEKGLNELDTKLTQWVQAVAEAQRSLCAQFETRRNTDPAPAESVGRSQHTDVGTALPEPETVVVEAPVQPEPPTASTPEPVAQQAEAVAEPGTSKKKRTRERRKAAAADRSSNKGSKSTPQSSSQADGESPAVSDPPVSSEEAMLAALDEDTRREVRIRRRLNPGKCMKLLIEEVRGAHADAEEKKAQQRKWWRIGN
jgi:hypothetical protein